MQPLNLPPHPFRLKKGPDSTTEIWDPLRNKYIILTPEEWVRQHFVQYLIKVHGLAAGRIAIEHGIKVNHQSRRCDIVYFNEEGAPYLIVECKRPNVKIDQSTFDQIARYNSTLNVPYLAVTNGLDHYYCALNHEKKAYVFLKELPRLT